MPKHARRGPALAAVATLTAALLGWAPTPAHAAGVQELEMMVDSGSGGDAHQQPRDGQSSPTSSQPGRTTTTTTQPPYTRTPQPPSPSPSPVK